MENNGIYLLISTLKHFFEMYFTNSFKKPTNTVIVAIENSNILSNPFWDTTQYYMEVLI
jgi:hypothetical protein